MDVIAVQAALPHIFDQQFIRKAFILGIGVCTQSPKKKIAEKSREPLTV
jgi:hypothetical protein